MNRYYAENVGTGGAPLAGVDPLLADREAAALLGCGRSTLWRWAAAGIIPKPLKIGGMSRWKLSWLTAVVDKAEAKREAV